MSLKAIIRKWTGKGGALNRTRDVRAICRLHVVASMRQVSVYDLD